jgi:hypothetical protein
MEQMVTTGVEFVAAEDDGRSHVRAVTLDDMGAGWTIDASQGSSSNDSEPGCLKSVQEPPKSRPKAEIAIIKQGLRPDRVHREPQLPGTRRTPLSPR